jgi:hypothetical protein
VSDYLLLLPMRGIGGVVDLVHSARFTAAFLDDLNDFS